MGSPRMRDRSPILDFRIQDDDDEEDGAADGENTTQGGVPTGTIHSQVCDADDTTTDRQTAKRHNHNEPGMVKGQM